MQKPAAFSSFCILPSAFPFDYSFSMREFLSGWSMRAMTCCILFWMGFASAQETPATPAVTNISQLYSLASQNPEAGYSIHLEGTVCWINSTEGRLVLRDS